MKEKDWKPSESDLNWTERTLSMLKIGGIWGTSYAIYKRTGANEITLIDVNDKNPDAKQYLERTKKAIKACGYDYVEG